MGARHPGIILPWHPDTCYQVDSVHWGQHWADDQLVSTSQLGSDISDVLYIIAQPHDGGI